VFQSAEKRSFGLITLKAGRADSDLTQYTVREKKWRWSEAKVYRNNMSSKEQEMQEFPHPAIENYDDGHKDYHEHYIRAAKGNYQRVAHQVSVHLIEARALAPNWTKRVLNPYAVISVCGRTQVTEIQRSTTNCLWDRRFSFPVLMLTDDEFRRENLYVQIFNANTFSRNELIGQYAFQLSRIHEMKRDHFDPSLFNHELYRKWVVLSNPAKPQLQQGFLMLSVRVLKPGDSPPTHSTDYGQLYAPENSKGFKPLVPPTIKRTSYSLNIRLYRGQNVRISIIYLSLSHPLTTK